MTSKKEQPNKKVTQATALKYDGENAPQIVAKGSGSLADKIIEQAKTHNVHIHNDPILSKVLAKLELGDEIPEQLYLAVAKIIAFAYFLQGKHPENYKAKDNQTDLSAQALEYQPKTIEDKTSK